MAAAFFMLAGAHGDALGVLARERGDPQLALLVGRLVAAATGLPGAATALPALEALVDQVSQIPIPLSEGFWKS